MPDLTPRTCTAFAGTRRIAHGPLIDVALAVKAAETDGEQGAILTFDDATGRVIDLDLRGNAADIPARLAGPADAPSPPDAPRGRGRPKLGVVPREVTLLPRQWEWLAAQSGGASQTLRRLVDAARRADAGQTEAKAARERAYRFMSAIAGDLPGFEEASRALFAGDRAAFADRMAAWPQDVRAHALALTETTDAERDMMMQTYLEPTLQAGRELAMRDVSGPIIMLNLLRLRTIADYSAAPELAPARPISGVQAYDRYIAHSLPFLTESGGELLLLAEGGSLLIGPAGERWDRAMLVRQSSIAAFMAFAMDRAYLAGLGHRTAAVEDSRLLPLTGLPLPV
jgi:hypothetical protein